MDVLLRWEAIFKGSTTGSIESKKWLVAEYFKSLGHLSEEGLEALTEQLKRKCTFFPSIKECLDVINVGQLSGEWGNPFVNRSARLFFDERAALEALSAPRTAGVLGRYGDGE